MDQKGLDILVPVIEEMAKQNWQLIVLGTGDEQYHKSLRTLQQRHPKIFGLNITFDHKLAKRIYSGCDFFLTPSQFEPCGLGPLFAMRFGTIPVVRETGGLADSVHEFNLKTGEGNGFLFSSYKIENLLATMKKAVHIFQDQKTMAKLIKNAMSCDFSWESSAKKYIQLYERVEKKSLRV